MSPVQYFFLSMILVIVKTVSAQSCLCNPELLPEEVEQSCCLNAPPKSLNLCEITWFLEHAANSSFYIPMASQHFVSSTAYMLNGCAAKARDLKNINLEVKFSPGPTNFSSMANITGFNKGAYVEAQCDVTSLKGTAGECHTTKATYPTIADKYYHSSKYWIVYQDEAAGVVLDVACTDGVSDWKVLSVKKKLPEHVRLQILFNVWSLGIGPFEYPQTFGNIPTFLMNAARVDEECYVE